MTARDWTIEKLENDWISIQVGREAPFRVHSSSVDSSQPTGYFVVAARFSKGTAGGVKSTPPTRRKSRGREQVHGIPLEICDDIKKPFPLDKRVVIAGLVSEKTFKKSFKFVIQRLNCAQSVAVANLKESDSSEIE